MILVELCQLIFDTFEEGKYSFILDDQSRELHTCVDQTLAQRLDGMSRSDDRDLRQWVQPVFMLLESL